jgi:acyl-CoA synthetase (AMP-forming)/AMP-acid ligase II
LAIVNPGVSAERDRSVIGFAHGAARAWVVEPRGELGDWLTPVGAVGELVISGPLLAQGYLNDAEKTAKAFVENPRWLKTFSDKNNFAPPTLIYRTGDLVRYRQDGAIEFIGRRDGQVKVNGQRIELGEIESRLSADGRVQLALVTQPKTGPCQKKLVAVLTLARGCPSQSVKGPSVSVATAGCTPATGPSSWQTQAQRDLEEVRSYLSDAVPTYMVPAVWVVLESMPVVVSGKLDRQQVGKWVEGLDEKTLEEITRVFGVDEMDEEEKGMTGPMRILRKCCAEELRVPEGKVKMGKSFLSLGELLRAVVVMIMEADILE